MRDSERQGGKAHQARRLYHFGPYRLDPIGRRLWRRGEVVTLTSKVFDVLVVLVSNAGRPMEKDEIMRLVWPKSFVEEGNLARNVSTLRKVLGDTPDGLQYIMTLPGRGYQFVHPIQEVVESPFGRPEARGAVPHSEEGNISLPKAGPTRGKWFKALVMIAAGLMVAVGLWEWLSWKPPEQPGGPGAAQPLKFAVLPFLWLSPASNEEHLGVGMADTLITRLSNLKRIIVRPTGSVLRYQAGDRDPQEIGRRLGVQFVLDGSLRRVEDRIRATARLVRVQDGSTIWADKFDEAWTDLLRVEDSITERTVTALALSLTGEEKRVLGSRGTRSVEAYQLYTKARYFWNKRSVTDLQMALAHFAQALDRDPDYALAHVGLADSQVLLAVFGATPPKDAYPRAKASLERALRLDPNMAEAHAALGHIKIQYDWDYAGAEREYLRALELNRHYSTTYTLYAILLAQMNRKAEAVATVEAALAEDPASPGLNSIKGAILYMTRQTGLAIEQLRHTTELEPYFWLPYFWLSLAYVEDGQCGEALVQAQKALQLSGGTNSWLLGFAQGACGRREDAQQSLENMMAWSRQRYIPAYDIAMIHLGLGQHESTLEWLEKGFQERSRWMDSLSSFPCFDPLRLDSRFQDLLRRLGLPH